MVLVALTTFSACATPTARGVLDSEGGELGKWTTFVAARCAAPSRDEDEDGNQTVLVSEDGRRLGVYVGHERRTGWRVALEDLDNPRSTPVVLDQHPEDIPYTHPNRCRLMVADGAGHQVDSAEPVAYDGHFAIDCELSGGGHLRGAVTFKNCPSRF